MTIPELQSEIKILKAKLSDLELELRAARIVKSGVSIGDLVLYRNEEYRVTYHKLFREDDRPWLTGVKKKQDGTWGVREVHLYGDWKKL